jgi:phosphomannomutase
VTSGAGGLTIASELRRSVEAWIDRDPDEATAAQLRHCLDAALGGDAAAVAELRDRFDGRLTFGTAGLRAELGAGPRRMNRVVVREAAAGFVEHLPRGATIVIGYDARHLSDVFAQDTARVVAAAGGRALLLPEIVPTPLLSFAIRHLGADAGVMCTASHNPPRDNGYKVYLADGAQIIPPVDAQIAERIDAVAARPDPPSLAPADDPAIVRLDRSVIEAYLQHVVEVAGGGSPAAASLSIVYTPMHGVGATVALEALRRCGYTHVHPVREQLEPDPDFPTVAFPNPEEPGALDLAIATARRTDAQVIIANDPDADRLGVAVPAFGDGPERAAWTVLTGNEIGALLAEHVLARTAGDDRLVVTTFVSSSLLLAQAAACGVHAERVLTGFKWVVRPALVDPSRRFVFGYEEALGFSVDEYVRDKDGVSAALAFAEVVAQLAAAGRTVWDQLEAISRRHGHHATRTWSVRFAGADAHDQMRAVMAALRTAAPEELAGDAVVGALDMAEGGPLPPADAFVLDLASGARVVVRPSGTEPKIKVYLEVVVPVADGPEGYAAARATGGEAVEALRAALAVHLGLPADGA